MPDGLDRRSFVKSGLAFLAVLGGGRYLVGPGAASADVDALPIRPPGALEEREFASRCIRCLRCAGACPNQCIEPLAHGRTPGGMGTPAIFPRRRACILCNGAEGEFLRCGEVCPTGALARVGKDAAEVQARVRMGVARVDEQLCHSYNGHICGVCYRACPFPKRALSIEIWEQPVVHAEACVGCGLCERACIRYPVAIRVVPAGNRVKT